MEARFSFGGFGALEANGALAIEGGDLYGSMTVRGKGDNGALVESSVFSIGGEFELQLNTSSVQEFIDVPYFDDGELAFRTVALDAQMLRIAGSAFVDIFGLRMEGDIELLIEGPTVALSVDLSLSMGFFGSISVSGEGFLGYTADEGAVFALRLEAGAKALDIGLISIEAGATLMINTSTKQEYAGVEKNTFLLGLNGSSRLLVFEGDFAGSVGFVDGDFELRIDKYRISYFGVVTLNVEGYIRSANDFSFEAEAVMGIDLGILELSGRIYLAVSDSGFAGEISGALKAKIKLGFFTKTFTLAAFNAGISYNDPKLKVSIGVTIAGIKFSGSRTWEFGKDPVDVTSTTFLIEQDNLLLGEDDVLDVTIGGTIKHEEYTEYKIDDKAVFNGRLNIDVLESYDAKVGDTFDIITFDDGVGQFEIATGIYGYKDDLYFEIIQTDRKVQLVVREFVDGDDFTLIGETSDDNTTIGVAANWGYFGESLEPVTFDATLQFADQSYISGNLAMSHEETSVVLGNGTEVEVDLWRFAGRDVELFYGVHALAEDVSEIGLLSSHAAIGVALFTAKDDDEAESDDSRSWLYTAGTAGASTLDVVGMPYGSVLDNGVLVFSGQRIFGENEVGIENDQLLDLSGEKQIEIADDFGTLATFDTLGGLPSRFDLAGDLGLEVDGYEVDGEMFFTSREAGGVQAVGRDIIAAIEIESLDLRIGADSGSNFGLVIAGEGVAVEAIGEVILEGDLFYDTTAEKSSVAINRSGIELTGEEISADGRSYVFVDQPASTDSAAVGITGLDGRLGPVFSISGDFGFKNDKANGEVTVIAKNASVSLGTGDYIVGIENANLGLFYSADGIALEARSDSVFARFGDFFEFSATRAAVLWNTTGQDFVGTTIRTAGVSYIYEDLIASSLLREIRLDEAYLKIGDFFELSGDMAVSQNVDATVNVAEAGTADIEEIDIELLTIGAANLNGFAGSNPEDGTAKGLVLDDVNFALVFASELDASGDVIDTFIAAQADVQDAGITGFGSLFGDAITVDIDNVLLNLNLAVERDGMERVLDFTAPVDIYTGATSFVTFDMKGLQGELIQAAAHVEFRVGSFLAVEGDFAFQRFIHQTDAVNAAGEREAVAVDLLTFGAIGASAFAGAYRGTDDAIGFEMGSLNLAWALMNERGGAGRSWSTLAAGAGDFDVLGIEEIDTDIQFDFNAIGLLMNRAAADGTVIDFAGENALDVIVGPDDVVTFGMSGLQGEILEVSGNIGLNLYDQVEISGGFSYQQGGQVLAVSDHALTGETRSAVGADMTMFGFAGASAFIGQRGDDDNTTADDNGLIIENVDLALALFKERDGDRRWTSLLGNVGALELAGIDDITFSVEDTALALNRAAADGSVIDYQFDPFSEVALEYQGSEVEATDLNISLGVDASGSRIAVTFQMDDNQGDLLSVSGRTEINLFGFVTVKGGFAVETRSQTVVVSDGNAGDEYREVVSTDLFTLGLLDVEGFAGEPGADGAEGTGFTLSGLNLALAVFSERDGDRRWTSLEGNLDAAALIGVDGLTAEVADGEVRINREASDGTLVDFVFTDNEAFGYLEPIPDLSVLGEVDRESLVLSNSTARITGTGYVEHRYENNWGWWAVYRQDIAVDADGFVVGVGEMEYLSSKSLLPESTSRSSLRLDNSFFSTGDAALESHYIDADGNRYTYESGLMLDSDGRAMGTGEEPTLIRFEQALHAADFTVLLGANEAGEQQVGRFTMDDSQGNLTRLAGTLTLDLFDVAEIDGVFAFERTAEQVVVSDNQLVDEQREVVNTEVLSLGIAHASAFVGVRGEDDATSDDDSGLIVEDLNLALAIFNEREGDRQWTTFQGDVGLITLNAIEGLDAGLSHAQLRGNYAATDGTVIDYSFSDGIEETLELANDAGGVDLFTATLFEIEFSNGDQVSFDIDDSRGDLFEVSGRAYLDLFGVVSVEGGFAINRGSTALVVSSSGPSGEEREVLQADVINFGLVDASAFVGVRGDDVTTLDDDTGLVLEGVDLALALFTGEERDWATVRANVDLATFAGVDGIEASLTDTGLLVNKAADDGSVIDYSATEGEAVITLKAFTPDKIETRDPEELEALNEAYTYTHVKKSTPGYFTDTEDNRYDVEWVYFSGKKAIGGIITLEDGTIYQVEKIKKKKWEIVGVVTDEIVPTIDFAATEFSMMVGVDEDGEAQTYSFDIDDSLGDLVRVSGHAELTAFETLEISGGFAFEQRGLDLLSIQDPAGDSGLQSSGEAITFGIAEGNAFVGLRGNDDASTDDDSGFALEGVDFAFVQITERNEGWKYSTVQAEIGEAALLGVDGLDFALSDVRFQANRADVDGWVIDYSSFAGEGETELEVQLGVDSEGDSRTLRLDIQEERGDFTQLSGHLRGDVMGIVTIEGGFAVERASDRFVYLAADGEQLAETVDTDLLTIGLFNANAFAGNTRGTEDVSDDLGLGFGGANMALAVWREAEGDRKWTSLQGTLETASFVGIDDIEIAVTNSTIVLNQAASDGTVVDYAPSDNGRATELSAVVGANDDGEVETVEFGLDGNDGEISRVSGELTLVVEDFITIDGGYAIRTQGNIDLLTDTEETVNASLLTFALDDVSVFAGVQSGDKTVGMDFSEIDVALAIFADHDSDRSWSALQAAGNATFFGIDGLDFALDSTEVYFNKGASDGSVIDFAAMGDGGSDPFSVVVGSDTFGRDNVVFFELDGARGEQLGVAGELTLGISQFFHIAGGFAFTKSDFAAVLSSGEGVSTDLLTFGLQNVTLFAGVAHGTDDAMGITLEEVNLALAILTEQVAGQAAARQWVSLNATAGSAGFIAPIEALNFGFTNIGVELNTAADDGTAVDFTESTLAVEFVDGESVDFDSSGESLKVFGDVSIDLESFVVIDGEFTFERSEMELDLTDGEIAEAEVLVFGITDANIFAGANHGKDNATGISLTDLNVGVALVSAAHAGATRQWTTVQARGQSAGLVGIDGVTLNAENFAVLYNSAAEGVAIDYASSEEKITYGGETFAMMGETLQVSGTVDLAVKDFFSVSGTIEVSKIVDTVTLSDGSTAEVETMAVTGYGLSAFAGLNGGSANRAGFVLDDTNFALLSMAEIEGAGRSWTALQADIALVGFVGVDDFEISGENISVEINTGASDGVGGETVVDFTAMTTAGNTMSFTGLLPGGGERTLTMDLDGASGAYIELSGQLNLNLFGFYQSSNFYSLRLGLKTLTLNDGSTTQATMMTFARSNLDARAGAGDVAFEMNDLDFGLAIISDGARTWVSGKATVASAGLVGIDGITATATDLELIINTGAFSFDGGLNYDAGLAIDYGASSLRLSDSILLDGDIARELYRINTTIDLNLFNFFTVEGDLAFEKSTLETTLQETGEVVTVDALSLAATDLEAFAGLTFRDYRLGFELEEADFAFAIFSERGGPRSWTSLIADVGRAEFVGVDGLVIKGTDLSVRMNRSNDSTIGMDLAQLGYSAGGIAFDFNEADTARIEGQMDLNIFGLYRTSDYYSFDKNFQTVVFADGTTGTVDILTLGGSVDRVLLGVNEGTESETGIVVQNAGFGLALAIDTSNPTNFWVTAQASGELAEFVGIDDLTMKVEDVEFVLNTASSDGRVIDYSAANLDVTFGASVSGQATSEDVAYTLDTVGEKKLGIEVGYGEIDLGGFVQVIGSFALEKGDNIFADLTVEGGAQKALEYPILVAQAVWSAVQENLPVADIFSGATSFQDIFSIVKDAVTNILALGNPVEIVEAFQDLIAGIDFSRIENVELTTLTIGAANVNVFAGAGGYFNDSNEDGRIYTEEFTDGEGTVWAADDVNEDATGFILQNTAVAIGLFNELESGDSYFALKSTADKVGLVGFDNIELLAQDIEVVVNSQSSAKSIDFTTLGEGFLPVSTGAGAALALDMRAKRIGVDVGQAILRVGGFLSLQGGFAFNQGESMAVDVSTGLGDLATLGDSVLDAVGLSKLLDRMGLSGSGLTHFEDVQVSTMTIGGSNLQAFVGVGGPYKQDFDWDTDSDGDGNPYNDFYINPEAVGLALSDVDFGLVLMDTETPILSEVLTQFQAGVLDAGFAGLVGTGEDINSNGVIDTYIPQDLNGNGVRDGGELEFTPISEDLNGNGALDADVLLGARDINIQLNWGDKWGGVLGPAVVDFKSSFRDYTEDLNGNGILDEGEDRDADGEIDTAAFGIRTGGNQVVYIDYDQSILSAEIGRAELKMGDFLILEGSFSISQRNNQSVVVNSGDLGQLLAPIANAVDGDSSKVRMEVDMLTIAATDLYGFAGIGGTRSHDTNNDGVINEQDALDDGAVGIAITDADLAVALSTPSLAQIPGAAQFAPKFVSAKATVDYAGLVGTDSFLEANVQDVDVELNFMLAPPALLATPGGAAVYGAALVAGALPAINFVESFSGEDTNNNFKLDEGENLNGANAVGEVVLDRGLLLNERSGNPFFMDFDEEVIAFSGYGEFSLLGGIQLSAGFSVGKRIEDITLRDGIGGRTGTGEAVTLHLAIADGYGFIADPTFYAAQNAIRTAIHGFEAGYWKDVNGDGKITAADGGEHIDHPVIGIALEDFNAGIVLMRQTGLVDWEGANKATETALNVAGLANVYAGVTASFGSIELVGIPGVTLAARDFGFDANFALNPAVSVDFSKSGEGRSGLVLDIAEGIDLDFSHLARPQLSIGGQAVLDVLGMATFDGVFFFEADKDGISVFLDVNASIGGSVLGFKTDATGVLALLPTGLALKATIEANFDVGEILDIEAALTLEINTTGSDFTFVVPEQFVDTTGFTEFVVSGTPPGRDDPVDAYASLYGNGSMDLLGVASVIGNFQIDLIYARSSGEFTASLSAFGFLEIEGLASIAAAGSVTFGVEDGQVGIYGGLEIESGTANPLLDVGGLVLTGRFVFQINTFNTSRQVTSVALDDRGNVIGTELVEVGANTLLLEGEAGLSLFGLVKASGSVRLKISPEGFEGAVELAIDLGVFGEISVSGAAVLNTAKAPGGPAFALSLETNLSFGFKAIGVKANALVQFNTGNTELIGVKAKSFRIGLKGDMNLLVLRTTFEGAIAIEDGRLSLEVSEARLKLGPLNVTFQGYIDSDLNFSFRAGFDFDLKVGPIRVQAGAFIEISNSGFAGGVSGSVDIDFGRFLGTLRLVGFEAEIRLQNSTLSFRAGATLLGITIRRTFSFDFDPPPVLGSISDGVLTLPSNSSGRDYQIEGAGGNDVVIRRGNDFNHFSDVHTIVFSGGKGDDYVEVLDSVEQKLVLEGGDGDDVFLIHGGSDDSIIDMGSGDDLVEGGLAHAQYRLGPGNDRFVGGSGNERVIVAGGSNVVHTGGGDDVVVLEAGTVDFVGGAGNDVAEISLQGDDSLLLGDHFLAYGNQELRFDGSVESIKIDGPAMAQGDGSSALRLFDQGLGQEIFAADIAQKTGVTLDGMLVDDDGNVYVSAPEDELIYRITPDGEVSVFAGNDSGGKANNVATGDRLSVGFERQFGLAWNADKSVMYVADKDNDTIRQVDMTTGVISTFYDFTSFDSSNKIGPADMVVAPDGTMYVTIWSSSNGSLYRIEADGSDHTRLKRNLKGPWGLQYDDGFLYFVENSAGRIVKYNTLGQFQEVVVDDLDDPHDLAFTADGAMIYADAGKVFRRALDGTTTVVAEGFGDEIRGLALHGNDIYVVDEPGNQVHRIFSVGGMDFGSTDLQIVTDGVLDVQDFTFVAPEGHLSLMANGIRGSVNTTVEAISVANLGTNPADVVVVESDGLVVVEADWKASERFSSLTGAADPAAVKAGLFSASGIIDLDAGGSFQHASGIISGNGDSGSLEISAQEAVFASGVDSFDLQTLNLKTESPIKHLILDAPQIVNEGGQVIYRAFVAEGASSDLRVALSNGAIITIAAGAKEGSVIVDAPADNIFIDQRSVSARIAAVTGESAANIIVDERSLRTQVADVATPTTLTLTADREIYEGESITYTVTLDRPVGVGDTLLVTLSNGLSLSIAAGETTASGSVPTTETEEVKSTIAAVFVNTTLSNRFEAVAISDVPTETKIADVTDLSKEDVSLLQAVTRISIQDSSSNEDQSNDDSEDAEEDDDSNNSSSDPSGANGSVTGSLGNTQFVGDGGSSGNDQNGDEKLVDVEIDTFAEEVYL
ncbi:MAG: hypothetical protein SynsKO_24060 [Synoicihabitans sp.]